MVHFTDETNYVAFVIFDCGIISTMSILKVLIIVPNRSGKRLTDFAKTPSEPKYPSNDQLNGFVDTELTSDIFEIPYFLGHGSTTSFITQSYPWYGSYDQSVSSNIKSTNLDKLAINKFIFTTSEQ